MVDSLEFKSRISEAERVKRSRIILALDLADSPDLHGVALRTISSFRRAYLRIEDQFSFDITAITLGVITSEPIGAFLRPPVYRRH